MLGAVGSVTSAAFLVAIPLGLLTLGLTLGFLSFAFARTTEPQRMKEVQVSVE